MVYRRARRRRLPPGLVVVAAMATTAGCGGGLPTDRCPAMPVGCPATVPTAGVPCTGPTPAGGCEYGADPFYYCDAIAFCDAQSGGWSVIAPAGSIQGCPTTLAAGCPASFAEAQATALACAPLPAGLVCPYPEGECACGTGYATLVCAALAPPGCPAARPLAGTPCSTAPGACTTWGHGGCDGQSMTCDCGFWRPVVCVD